MKKYKLFIDVTLVLLCLMPLIYGLAVGFRSGADSASALAQIVSELDISPSQSTQISGILSTYLTGSVPSPGFTIFSVIISNSIFVYVGYLFVSVLTFIPKMGAKLLRIGIRKED